MATRTSGSAPELLAEIELVLVPISFWLQIGRPVSLAALRQAMQEQLAAKGHPGAEPLRWAITGSDPVHGLRLEGVGLNRPAAIER